MESFNKVLLTKFILLGFSQNPRVQTILFFIFLTIYIITWLGNLTIIITVIFMPQFHTPMYFLLANLAVTDISDSTVTAIKMLWDLSSHTNTISYNWCITQVFFFHFTGGTVVFFLVVMAVDRYIAIYRPLQYLLIMHPGVCVGLVTGAWLGGFAHSIIQVALILQLPFCGSNILDNFFCDVPQLIKLACTDTYITELLMVSNSGFLLTLIFCVLLVSYTVILIKIRTHVTEGKHKALSTCGAQIIVISLNFVPGMFIYDRPFRVFPGDKIASVCYTLITPMLNPMIFTLRNREIKDTIRKLIRKMISLQMDYIIRSRRWRSSIFSTKQYQEVIFEQNMNC
ncbi:PREDICTED: olfactory receptor 4D1-like [Gekko japonicus]|uniref:Olfactory receptor 4D1-like n=1 Tax=Gekko japonicus TaxID=146911 RepID=A0ABM1JKE3_GEKJA|nr:PREDICTED: olfactory receptor 4D1-like [Gekko japonicus]